MQPLQQTVNRKHTLDETYFDNIDTERKAYWLGFLWADGSVSKTAPRCAGYNRLTLTQKVTEKQHLQLFLTNINANYNLYYKQDTNVYSVHINSRHMCEALLNLGYGTKDKRIHIPKIPKTLMHHFIRGYFDGDGCLSVYQQHYKTYTINKQEWSLTGNPTLLHEIKTILETDANTTPTIKMKTYKRTDKAVGLRYGKKADIEQLYDYLYDNATIYLETKYNKFIEYFSR